jgi:hypothetical protein
MHTVTTTHIIQYFKKSKQIRQYVSCFKKWCVWPNHRCNVFKIIYHHQQKHKPVKHIHTSWMSAVWRISFLLFITLTMAACIYNFLSSSTEESVCSTSWGVSRCTAAVIRNFVRLLLYSKFKVNTVSGVCVWTQEEISGLKFRINNKCSSTPSIHIQNPHYKNQVSSTTSHLLSYR